MKILAELIIKILDRLLPALIAYRFGKTKQQKDQARANYEQAKRNADIAAGPDVDNPADRL